MSIDSESLVDALREGPSIKARKNQSVEPELVNRISAKYEKFGQK